MEERKGLYCRGLKTGGEAGERVWGLGCDVGKGGGDEVVGRRGIGEASWVGKLGIRR